MIVKGDGKSGLELLTVKYKFDLVSHEVSTLTANP